MTTIKELARSPVLNCNTRISSSSLGNCRNIKVFLHLQNLKNKKNPYGIFTDFKII